MTANAMSFCCISCRNSIAAQNIHSICNSFQMVGVNTSAILAKVVNLKPFWNFTFEHFIRNTVSAAIPTSDSQVSVTI